MPDDDEPKGDTTTVEIKLFAQHDPTGFVAHITRLGPKAGSMAWLDNSLEYLVAHDFSAHQGWGVSAPPVRADGNVEKCEVCGSTMVFRSGTSKKTGKPYKMWSCPTDKDHPPVWVNDED